jgi:hypothetical protein
MNAAEESQLDRDRVRTLADRFSLYKYHASSEAELHDAIANVLRLEDFPFAQEADIGAGCRVDFLVDGDIALEIKTKGGTSEIARQVERYAASPLVSAVLLATTLRRHEAARFPRFYGKAVIVVRLPGWMG